MDNPKTEITNAFPVVIFWASVWGIVEATIGWLLHTAHVPGVGYIIYSLALVCMTAAVNFTGRSSTAAWVAAGAAAIKLTDLFLLDGRPFYYVTNPAIYILLEGCATAAFFRLSSNLFDKKTKMTSYLKAFSIGVGCAFAAFVVFKLWQAGMSAFVEENPGVALFWQSSRISSAVIQILTKGAWLTVALRAVKRMAERNARVSLKISPVVACISGFCAIIITLVTF